MMSGEPRRSRAPRRVGDETCAALLDPSSDRRDDEPGGVGITVAAVHESVRRPVELNSQGQPTRSRECAARTEAPARSGSSAVPTTEAAAPEGGYPRPRGPRALRLGRLDREVVSFFPRTRNRSRRRWSYSGGPDLPLAKKKIVRLAAAEPVELAAIAGAAADSGPPRKRCMLDALDARRRRAHDVDRGVVSQQMTLSERWRLVRLRSRRSSPGRARDETAVRVVMLSARAAIWSSCTQARWRRARPTRCGADGGIPGRGPRAGAPSFRALQAGAANLGSPPVHAAGVTGGPGAASRRGAALSQRSDALWLVPIPAKRRP